MAQCYNHNPMTCGTSVKKCARCKTKFCDKCRNTKGFTCSVCEQQERERDRHRDRESYRDRRDGRMGF